MADLSCVKHQEDTEQLKLHDLPTDALLCIFKYCDVISLRNLSLTCKRFNNVATEDCLWVKLSNLSVVTNQISSEIRQRCFTTLNAKERCRISQKWISGCYTEQVYKSTIKYMPWLVLESNMLWMSRGKIIVGAKRCPKSVDIKNTKPILSSVHSEDISRFVKVDDIIYTGGQDKLICGWSTTFDKLLFYQQSKQEDVQGIDCKRNILVSGSKDGTYKVWQKADSGSSLQCLRTGKVCDRVWCINIDPSISYVATGSAGYFGIHPLNVYDLNRGDQISIKKCLDRKGAAVFDIIWESTNCLITCGFDSYIRLWDLRVGDCVRIWTDPFGAPGYCLASDLSFSVICGTAHHGRAQLWDLRASTGVQAFFGKSEESSPVYSVGFDSNQLYIAQDSCINLFEFKNRCARYQPHADYSQYWKRNMICL